MRKLHSNPLADVLAERSAQYPASAIANFEAAFDEPQSEHDVNMGLTFEAIALRRAAELVTTTARTWSEPPVRIARAKSESGAEMIEEIWWAHKDSNLGPAD